MTLSQIVDAINARKAVEYTLFVETFGKKSPNHAFMAGALAMAEVSTLMTVVGAINDCDDVENPVLEPAPEA